MNKVKIFVCSHKPVENILQNDVYRPLHLERVNSPYKKEMKEYEGDDTGENISERGAYYSEGTGIYWIWKNVNDCEYVGLTQYRRQFNCTFTSENIDSYFKDGTDVVMSRPILRPKGRFFTVLTYMQMEDFLILRGVIKKISPEYLTTLNQYLRSYSDRPFNMVVCKKELYDKYAEWMFSICLEMEKYIRYSGYLNSKRLFGYVTELLTPIFFIHNKCKIKSMDVLLGGKMINQSWKNRLAMCILDNTIGKWRKDIPVYIDPSFYRGLKADGIDLDCTY